MSLANILSRNTVCSLIIPCAGKMFRSSISKKDKALCFVINKGYIETARLDTLYYMLEDVSKLKWLVFVGGINKVSTKSGIRYRQRVFFKSFVEMISLCKSQGITIELDDDFEIDINNVMFCLNDLKYLELYARQHNQNIDRYLTETCICQMSLLLKSKKFDSPINDRAEHILRGRIGYLDRAPYLVSSYNIENHTSSIYIPSNVDDNRIVSVDRFGYIESIVKHDKEKGVFQGANKK